MGSVYFFRNTCSDQPAGRKPLLEAGEAVESVDAVMFTEIAAIFDAFVNKTFAS
jgi:hypothetical protein